MTVLADTSAWIRAWRSGGEGSRAFLAAVGNGEVATCAMVQFELLQGARDFPQFIDLRDALAGAPAAPVGDAEWARALDVFGLMVRRDGLPAASHQDLLIAAAAEAAGLELLHHDRDFERIAAVTGQAVRWLDPPARPG